MQIKRFKRLYRAIEEGIGTVYQHHDKKAVKKAERKRKRQARKTGNANHGQ